eukprot:g6508.t1
MAKKNRRYRLPSEDLESIDLTEDYRLMDTSSKAPRTKVQKRSTIHFAKRIYRTCDSHKVLFFLIYTTCIALGLTLLILGPTLLDVYKQQQIDQEVVIDSPKAKGFESWRNSSVKSSRLTKVYIYNVTNPNEFLNKGEKIRIEEFGPFVFKVEKVKLNISWVAENDTVTYKEWTHHKFDPEKTRYALGNDWNDTNIKFTVVNGFFWGMRPQAGDAVWQFYFREYTDFDRMFAKLTVSEIINGYGKNNIFKFPGLQPNELTPQDAPPPHTVYVGKKIPERIGQYVKWRAMGPELSVTCPWDDDFIKDTCSKSKFPCCGGKSRVWQYAKSIPKGVAAGQPNVVMGGDGEKFQRGNQASILIFVDPIVRHVLFLKQPKHYVHKGVQLNQYSIPVNDNKGLDNATAFPFNNAYYMYGPRGIQNGTMIEKGAPIYFSMPHFAGVGEDASRRVMGFDKSKVPFRTLIGVEPSLGLTFFARQGLQINVQVQTVKISNGKSWFPGIMKGHTYIPLAWIEKTSESTDSAAAEWLSILNSLLWITISIYVVGIVITALSLFLLVKLVFKIFSSDFSVSSNDASWGFTRSYQDISAVDGASLHDIVGERNVLGEM